MGDVAAIKQLTAAWWAVGLEALDQCARTYGQLRQVIHRVEQ